MLFLYLFLGHLIADYLLQPHALVAWKNRSLVGVAVHASVHVLVETLLLYLYTGSAEVFYLALLIGVMHFIIDSLKASHDRNSKHSQFTYWIDQCLHYLSLMITLIVASHFPEYFHSRAFIQGPILEQLYVLFFNPLLVSYLCLVIFSTLTIEYSFYKDRQKTKGKVPPLNYKHMIERLLLTTIIFLGLILSFVPSVGLYFGG
ncbi:DUF3307 domain-containing protein [Candidatus Peregrinibacteria bacterium]|nr:DUF3307 domain-containing protein [Candidatus Peregrinibacteria bacterium]